MINQCFAKRVLELKFLKLIIVASCVINLSGCIVPAFTEDLINYFSWERIPEEDVDKWQALGLGYHDAVGLDYHGVTPEVYREYTRLGITDKAQMKTWAKNYYNPEQALAVKQLYKECNQLPSRLIGWDKLKFEPKDAQVWDQNNISPYEAKRWLEFGLTQTQGIEWAKYGFITRDVKPYLAAGLSPAESAQIKSISGIYARDVKELIPSAFKSIKEMIAWYQPWMNTNLSITTAYKWDQIGVTTPKERSLWLRHNFHRNYVKKWKSANFSADQAGNLAARWPRISLTQVQILYEKGLDSYDKIYAWNSVGYSFEQIVNHLESGTELADLLFSRDGILPNDAAQWQLYGFNADEASMLIAYGIYLNKVEIWKRHNINKMQTIIDWHSHGFNAASAAKYKANEQSVYHVLFHRSGKNETHIKKLQAKGIDKNTAITILGADLKLSRSELASETIEQDILWYILGFTKREQSKLSKDCTALEAKQWKLLGSNCSHLHEAYLSGVRHGEVRASKLTNFTTIGFWYNSGFFPVEAASWFFKGVSIQQALEYKKEGKSAKDI